MQNNNSIKKPNRKEIYIVATFFCLVFIGMIIYLAKYVSTGARDFIYNPYNSRFSVFNDDVTRGNIYTADGHVIASTKLDDDRNQYRDYPDGSLFCHAVGYVGNGMAGLEADYSFDLLKSHIELGKQIENTLSGNPNPGDDLFTTFDYDTQIAAYDGLGLFDGAVIAIDPDTGKVVAMVSRPTYDPNDIAKRWEEFTSEDSNKSVLLNRATSGAYPPGSTFKIITTVAYLRANNGNDDFSYKCNGYYKVDDYKIHCSSNEVHGQEDLLKAFSNSCNSAYASIGLEIDRDVFINTTNDLLFNQELPTSLGNTKKSKFNVTSSTENSIVAQSAIGQGDTLVSPLHMCMIVSAIANDGILMKPYMAEKIESKEGDIVQKFEPEEYGRLVSPEEAALLNEYMEAVVYDGTARKVDFGDLKVYGKTGTAEYTKNKNQTHSWFVGYATDASGKKLAVAVIMEGAGYGSKHAAPLAADVFKAYFN